MGVSDGHPPPHLCRDQDCDRYGCVLYRQGYADGHADGLADCARTHQEDR